MDTQHFIAAVLEKDFSVQLYLPQINREEVIPELMKLTKHGEVSVRELALVCLDELGGNESLKAQFTALYDAKEQVRNLGMDHLSKVPMPSLLPFLWKVLDTNPHEYIRQQTVFLLGKLPTTDPNELRNRSYKETFPLVREAFVIALARMGNPEAIRWVSQEMTQTRGRERQRWLRHVSYINAPWLIRPLAEILDDEEPMERIGVDARPDFPHYLRACDIAAGAILRLGYLQFSFTKPKPPIVYSPEQRAEIRKTLALNRR
ncbi:MAG TPA: hypothetical protein PLL64_03505 [Rhodothermales bacterium]|nr:hypothetical protein [Bacteroidota bacterium]HRK73315.1 hypothetical protein [Rhodothermales bacterium]HRR07130.1 hypothetical protein [Rhodothermales bacterium]